MAPLKALHRKGYSDSVHTRHTFAILFCKFFGLYFSHLLVENRHP